MTHDRPTSINGADSVPDGGPGATQFGALMDKLIRLTVSAWAVCVVLVAGAAVTEPAESSDDQLWTKTPVFTAENLQTDCSAMDTGYGSGEDPNEGEYITEALVAQGYFREDVPLDYSLQDHLHTACEANNVPYHVALGLIWVESRFDPEAVGPDGYDIGLFQIRTSNHAWLSAETGADPLTPAGNIECGVWLIGYLLNRYEATDAALTAYRWGHDNGDRIYANKVLRAAEAWEVK